MKKETRRTRDAASQVSRRATAIPLNQQIALDRATPATAKREARLRESIGLPSSPPPPADEDRKP